MEKNKAYIVNYTGKDTGKKLQQLMFDTNIANVISRVEKWDKGKLISVREKNAKPRKRLN